MLKNWAMHNIVGHPLMQIFYFLGMPSAAKWIHDSTLPLQEDESENIAV